MTRKGKEEAEKKKKKSRKGREDGGFRLSLLFATQAGLYLILHHPKNKNRCGSGAWAATQALGLAEVLPW